MKRHLACALVVASYAAYAESSWLVSRGNVQRNLEVAALLGTHEVAAALFVPQRVLRAGTAIEVAYQYPDKNLALRAGWSWQFLKARYAHLSLVAGLSGLLIPFVAPDFALGPHAALNLSLGKEHLSLDISLQTGVDLFIRNFGARFVERAQLGFHFKMNRAEFLIAGRAGADFEPGHFFAIRAEFLVGFGLTDF